MAQLVYNYDHCGELKEQEEKKKKGQCWKWRTCTKVRLAASAQDGIKLWLISSHFIFPGSIEFLLPMRTHGNGRSEHGQACQLHVTHVDSAKAAYLGILFGKRDVDGRSFITISLNRTKHLFNSLYFKRLWGDQKLFRESSAGTWERETRSLRKWPEVSLLMESSKLFPYSGGKLLVWRTMCLFA